MLYSMFFNTLNGYADKRVVAVNTLLTANNNQAMEEQYKIDMEKNNIIKLTKIVIKDSGGVVKKIDEPDELNKFFEEKIGVSYEKKRLVVRLQRLIDKQIRNALKTESK